MEFNSEIVEKVLAGLLSKLGVSAVIQVDLLQNEQKNYWEIKIDAPEAGADLIGRHGATLEALSTVISLMLPKGSPAILLDINNYKQQRAAHLETVANQAATQAVTERHEVILESMQAWERRLVHNALAVRSDIKTESFGEDPDRRIVIKPNLDY